MNDEIQRAWERITARVKPRWNNKLQSWCYVWQGQQNRGGYGRVTVAHRTRLVHSIAWEVHNGPMPEGHMVHHKCEVKLCCNIDHLEEKRNNREHGWEHRRHGDDVTEYILKRRAEGASCGTIGEELGIHAQTIWRRLKRIGEPTEYIPITHCSKGHELTENNIYIESRNGRTYRRCKICSLDRQKKYDKIRRKK